MNLSGIHPQEYKCLILPDKIEEKTAGGIIKPQTSRDRDQHAVTTGTLVDFSPIAFSFEDRIYPWPKKGNRVVYQKYAGSEIDGKDKQTYRLINDRDIYAVLEPDNA